MNLQLSLVKKTLQENNYPYLIRDDDLSSEVVNECKCLITLLVTDCITSKCFGVQEENKFSKDQRKILLGEEFDSMIYGEALVKWGEFYADLLRRWMPQAIILPTNERGFLVQSTKVSIKTKRDQRKALLKKESKIRGLLGNDFYTLTEYILWLWDNKKQKMKYEATLLNYVNRVTAEFNAVSLIAHSSTAIAGQAKVISKL